MESRYPFLILGILAVFSLIPAAYAATPSIGLNVTYPAGNLSVNQYRFFHITTNVSCLGADCGDINVSLDPYPSQCTGYTPINWDANSIDKPYTTGDCTSGLTPGWYRFTGTYTKIPVQRSYINYICNTHAPGFLDFSYPTSPGETTSGRICYHWSGSTCNWESTGIQVTACAGYYVYYLTPSPTCTLHPCTTDAIPDPPQSKSGLINDTVGEVPFYTNQSNPRTINLNAGQSQLVTFWVNATGGAWDHTFFAYANQTSNMSVNNQTSNWTVSVYPPPTVSFIDLPSFVKTSDPAVDVTINLSADYFFGAPDSAILGSIWWNHGAGNIPYTAPVNHSFSLGSYTLTAYANDTDGNIYSSVRTLDISSLECGDSIDSDTVMTANLDCSGYSGNAVQITGDNIVFDCDGYSITGAGNSYTGIYLNGRSNVTIQNCNITDFYDGIYLNGGQENQILRNYLGQNNYGLYLYYSDFNSVLYNNFDDNDVGFYLYEADSNQIGRNNATSTYTSNFGGTSCPFLYTWNGTGYDFITDMSSDGKVGSTGRAARFKSTAPGDYSRIDGGQLQPVGGAYSLQVTEEYDEVSYLDELALLTVDHSPDVDIFTGITKATQSTIYTVSKTPSAPLTCTDKLGNDCLPDVSARDNLFTDPPVEGLNQSLVLGLGDLSDAESIKLVISYAKYPDLPSGAGKSKSIQVRDASGNWVEVYSDKEISSASLTKTYVADLTGKFPTDDYSVRLVFLSSIFDYVAVDTTPQEPVAINRYYPASADLHYRGYSAFTETPILDFDYSTLINVSLYQQTGNFTKYGDVMPLLTLTDDMYVIMHNGDEVSLSFPYEPADDGLQRDFLMYSYAYYKAAKGITGTTVEPLPFRGMSNYPYASEGQSYPEDAEHQAYLAEWNTRRYEPDPRSAGSLPYSFNNTVYENNIIGGAYSTGLYLDNEEETKILDNRISGVEVGIDIYDSSDTTVTGNRVLSEGGRALIVHRGSSGSIVEDNTFHSDSSESCNLDGCGAVYLGRTYDNVFEGNELTAIDGTGLAVGYSDGNEFTDNEISATGEYYAIHLWGGAEAEKSLLLESGNNFLHNTIQSDLWVNDEDGGNTYSDEGTGNAYYTEDGTPASQIFNITDTDGNGWADGGSDLPFGCDKVGECDSDYYFWSGEGEDWHPFVSAPSDSRDDDTQTKPVSLEMTSACGGNVVIVDGAGNDAHVVIKDSEGNILAAGDTEGDEFSFSGCGLEGLTVKATQSGFLPGTLSNQDTISCSECGLQNETPGCTLDSDCLSNQRCTSGQCVNVPCECGTLEDHQCMPYACCSDSQCAADELCDSHICKKRPAFECTSDAQCPATKYCDKPTGAAGGSCKDVTGQCGKVVNHAFVPYGYECGIEAGCPICPSGSSCESHVCMAKNDLSCPSTGIVGDKKTCAATENNQPCPLCDFVYTDPAGKNFTGRTDEMGNFDLPLNMQGTYKVALMKDGAVVKIIEVKAFPQAQPQEPQKPAATGPDLGAMLALVVLLLLLVLGIVYWRSRGQKKK